MSFFADLFPSRGQPAEAPWRLALVTVMQFLEGLPHRQAAEAVRSRLDWKYLLGLEVTDAGFHSSVISAFRSRLLALGAEQRLFEVLLTHFKAHGWLTERQCQRTDSTHLVAAVRSLNRLELVGRPLQHTLNLLAEVAPDWLLTQISPEWFERYSHPVDDYRLRHPRRLPPSAERIASPHDIEARYSTKRSVTWVGYTVHLTETCDEGSPHLIPHVETTPATEGDSRALPRLHEARAARELLPGEHIVETTYGSADVRHASQAEHGVTLVCPVQPDMSWQSQEKGVPLRDSVCSVGSLKKGGNSPTASILSLPPGPIY